VFNFDIGNFEIFSCALSRLLVISLCVLNFLSGALEFIEWRWRFYVNGLRVIGAAKMHSVNLANSFFFWFKLLSDKSIEQLSCDLCTLFTCFIMDFDLNLVCCSSMTFQSNAILIFHLPNYFLNATHLF